MLPVLMLLAGIAINIAYLQLTATELKISTDVAAKAAGGVYTRTLDLDLALAAAQQAGEFNTVASAAQKFQAEDLTRGSSSFNAATGSYNFAVGNGNNALRVAGRRDDGSLNGKIGTLLGERHLI
jgi:hypothetical protein